jgi:hypothetical protein
MRAVALLLLLASPAVAGQVEVPTTETESPADALCRVSNELGTASPKYSSLA